MWLLNFPFAHVTSEFPITLSLQLCPMSCLICFTWQLCWYSTLPACASSHSLSSEQSAQNLCIEEHSLVLFSTGQGTAWEDPALPVLQGRRMWARSLLQECVSPQTGIHRSFSGITTNNSNSFESCVPGCTTPLSQAQAKRVGLKCHPVARTFLFLFLSGPCTLQGLILHEV